MKNKQESCSGGAAFCSYYRPIASLLRVVPSHSSSNSGDFSCHKDILGRQRAVILATTSFANGAQCETTNFKNTALWESNARYFWRDCNLILIYKQLST